MAYIYKIYNDINNKLYIGKTMYQNIDKRFREHCRDAFKSRNDNRPLYRAMRKYGIDKFHIALLEETADPNTREIYWINKLNTYHFGYNATRGGDGKSFLDYDAILNLWNTGLNCTEISKQLGYSADQIGEILASFGITKQEKQARGLSNRYLAVCKLDLAGNILMEYACISDAARELISLGLSHSSKTTTATHIKEVCCGKRKSCWKFKWRFKK